MVHNKNMNIPRIIPCLLLKNNGLVKGIKFRKHRYVGDPLNAVKIFNDKEVDELIFLDISATDQNKTISVELVRDIADECYMPFCVGGGIANLNQIEDLIASGAEKVCINTAAFDNPEIIKEAAQVFGSQSIIVSVDVKTSLLGTKYTFSRCGKKKLSFSPIEAAKLMEESGAGEIFLNSIDRDGTCKGYDLSLINEISQAVNIPVIACGGAWETHHLKEAIDAGAAAVAAGSMFVFIGKYKAVLINYPDKDEIKKIFSENSNE